MPEMKKFLIYNNPWKQLVQHGNIKYIELANERQIILNDEIYVKPFLVPHRNEISETVGYRIKGVESSIIYLRRKVDFPKYNLSLKTENITMFFILSKILSFLIKPTFWILLLIISSIIFKSKRKRLLYISLFVFWLQRTCIR